ncbi:trichohyalin-like [Aedes albopictus]|uniref:Retrotransposon gag domain-containing protein n=1 Tax=Aedes albopictus TaxID=7160 RepID=A0ABM1XXN8_AEDAL
MDSKLASIYRSMNVNHLLDDELEYELALRKVVFTSGESRDIKRRKLRGAMKEERESNRFVSRTIVEEAREGESRQVGEKLAMIRDSLENRKAKKTELPQLETRLVHLYFRLLRLKKVFNTAGLEQIALGLLREYFAGNSRDPEVVGEYSKRSLDRPSDLNAHQPGNEVSEESEEEVEEESNPRTESENVESSEENSEELDFTVRNLNSRRSSTPKVQDNKVVNADELFDRIMQQVEKVITSKLKTLDLGAKTRQRREVREKMKVPSKQTKTAEKPQYLKVENSKQPKKKDEQRDAEKLKLIKKRNRVVSESSDVSRASERETDHDSEQTETETEDEEQQRIGQRLKRRPRPVCDWKLKYDGKDEGRGLNKFVSEVEYMAEAENISKRSLFNEAIHLFSGDARAWYIEGRRNREFRNWNELVVELKVEYQPPDMDYHYEQQAASRRQKRGEKFQDYYHAIKEIFEQMSAPPTDQRKFEIIFRNLRSDYKNSLLVKGVRTLRMLKVWGRKLDSANWFLYRKQESEHGARSAQVHEINGPSPAREYRPPRNNWKKTSSRSSQPYRTQNSARYQGPKNDYRGPRRSTPERAKREPPAKPKQVQSNEDPKEGSSKDHLQKRIEEYRIPERTVCFNCRGNYHHSSACLKAKEVFCTTCGFQGFSKPDCPFCAKNGKRSM